MDRREAVRSSDASTEDPTQNPSANRARGEGNQDSAPSPQRAVVRVDGVSAYAGPAWKAEEAAELARTQFPEAEVTIEPEEGSP